jgi:IS5 family transposase
MSLSESGFERKTKRTRKREFLDEINLMVWWAELVALVAQHALMPGAKGGRPPYALRIMMRLHFLQQWFNLSKPAMEDVLYDMPMFREFAKLDASEDNLPDESTILRFRHLLEAHSLSVQILVTVNVTLAAKGLYLKSGTVVDATLISAPKSTKNGSGERDPEMHQTKKGNQGHFGMKVHIGVDADSGLVYTVKGKAANAHDTTLASELLHGKETDVFADSGYRGFHKREEVIKDHAEINLYVATMPSHRKALDKDTPMGAIMEVLEKTRARIRAEVEHPFRAIKRQFGHVKSRYRRLVKNPAQLHTLSALSNIWMVRRALLKEWLA